MLLSCPSFARSMAFFHGFKQVVLVKQVPDLTAGQVPMKPDGTIDRSKVQPMFNPPDLAALEAALDLKDRLGGMVFPLSMGPPDAEAVLRDCYRCGTDDHFLLTDRRLGGSDTLGTSYALALAVNYIERKWGPVDIVHAGMKALDGETGQVGPQVARWLERPCLPYVEQVHEVDLDATKPILADVIITGGAAQVRSTLPCVTVDAPTKYTIRTPLASRLMMMKDFRMEALTIEDIGLDVSFIGVDGSPTKVWVSEPQTSAEGFRNTRIWTPDKIPDLVAKWGEMGLFKEEVA
jgi:electron transfer flavoprotein alpha/beta subunit